MKKIILFVTFLFLFGLSSFSVSAQSQCPTGLVCLSQEAANKAAENARLIPQLQEKNIILETSLQSERENTKQAQETGRKNGIELVDRLHKTEIELATKTGQLISNEAEKTRLIAIVDALLKQVRPKKIGLINLF